MNKDKNWSEFMLNYALYFILGIMIVCVIIADRSFLSLNSMWKILSQASTRGILALGVAGMIAFQTFVNVGVATGIMPNTGMSLPFVSYGGSSMWTNMTAIGLVLNIGMKRSKSLFEGQI